MQKWAPRHTGGLCIDNANLKFSYFKWDQRGRERSQVLLAVPYLITVLNFSAFRTVVDCQQRKTNTNVNRFKEWRAYGCIFTFLTGDSSYVFCNGVLQYFLLLLGLPQFSVNLSAGINSQKYLWFYFADFTVS